ncbi:AAA-associated domain-containing protein [Synechococcus elongatus]|nr:AAA-associated domain-containing protein [Synechococcus elongatus]AJD58211.1 hypothetical protein M744_10410 [Synechococcus elongatus UTEX 2973]WKW06822.1 AAA-associated domain-containing protein [Synechococcus elongatus PCC 7942 = FACHB-805]
MPLIDAAVMLQFAELEQGQVQLTAIGKDFAATTILPIKKRFRQQVLQHSSGISSIVQTLRERRSYSLQTGFFLNLWENQSPRLGAKQQFTTAVDWGCYVELFEYDSREERLLLTDGRGCLEG